MSDRELSARLAEPEGDAGRLADRLKDVWHRWKAIVEDQNFGDQLDEDFDTIAASIAALRSAQAGKASVCKHGTLESATHCAACDSELVAARQKEPT